MVLLHIKHGDDSQFLYETCTSTPIDQLLCEVLNIYNGRLKIQRIVAEMEELAKHGTMLPAEMLGLTDEQVEELKLRDDQGMRNKTCSKQKGETIYLLVPINFLSQNEDM